MCLPTLREVMAHVGHIRYSFEFLRNLYLNTFLDYLSFSNMMKIKAINVQINLLNFRFKRGLKEKIGRV